MRLKVVALIQLSAAGAMLLSGVARLTAGGVATPPAPYRLASDAATQCPVAVTVILRSDMQAVAVGRPDVGGDKRAELAGLVGEQSALFRQVDGALTNVLRTANGDLISTYQLDVDRMLRAYAGRIARACTAAEAALP